MERFINILKQEPPARVPIDVIFDDNVTRRMVYNDNLDCLEPIQWWERGFYGLNDDMLFETKTLSALAWRKVESE
jgi:hypothetical protein